MLTNFFLVGVQPVFIIALIVFFVLLVVAATFFILFLRPWLTCFLSATPISLFNIIGMRLRRTDPKKILPVGITAKQAGFPISWASLESAHLQGIDIDKVATAYIAAKKRELDFSFEELVDAERESRLSDLVKF